MLRQKIAMLTAGGLAPSLSSSVGSLIKVYGTRAPDAEMIGYLGGYQGLLTARSIPVTPEVRKKAKILHEHGGSPIGNSRVKLTNVADCVKRGLVKEGQNPLEVAARQLERDGITILHTIGGDDTNMTATDLARYLAQNGYDLTVVGLPKTVDNDVVPIRQTLGAVTAAEQGAIFFENVVNEATATPRMLLVHEVMGRNCGWLTAATARAWRERLKKLHFLPEFHLERRRKDIDGIYIPEVVFDLATEAARLKRLMDEKDCVNIFLSEGAGAEEIVREMEARGAAVPRDAFGHVKLDKINVGEWFASHIGKQIGAGRTLVQKSGYFARSAAANREDIALIAKMAELAVVCALSGRSGVIGHDEEHQGELRAIEFERIRGGKPFDTSAPWFTAMLEEIGQPAGARAALRKGGED
ncbi:MAG: pyrophosphate--fructose-6-phosphate 1-phosphotransferase [Hyphomicrobiales bacterium]